MSESLKLDQICICIRTNLCHEISIRRMQLFLCFVTTLINHCINCIHSSQLRFCLECRPGLWCRHKDGHTSAILKRQWCVDCSSPKLPERFFVLLRYQYYYIFVIRVFVMSLLSIISYALCMSWSIWQESTKKSVIGCTGSRKGASYSCL